MIATLLNFGLGALIKLISAGFSQWIDTRRQVMLSVINADKDKIVALQSGTDTADPWTRTTRRWLAFMLVGTWCYIIVYITHHPEIQYTVFVGKHQSWLWEWLWPFPVNDKGVAAISAGELLWGMKSMIEILVGFFYTKVGK